MLITDKQLLSYQRCHRRGFLDAYGDPNDLDPPSDFLLKLMADSSAYQNTLLADQTYFKPQYLSADWSSGARKTLELMQQGVNCIRHGVLLKPEVFIKTESAVDSFEPNESEIVVTLVSCPELLIKHPGQSKFGDWVYIPSDLKLGKRPKFDYQIISALHAYLLEEIQGVRPERAWLVLRDKSPYGVNLHERIPQLLNIITGYVEMLLLEQEPEVFISRQKCNLCQWYSFCYETARSQNHLSLIPGVTPSRYHQLKKQNLITVEALANATATVLKVYPEFEDGVAEQVIRQAQSNYYNQAIKRIHEDSDSEEQQTFELNHLDSQNQFKTQLRQSPVEIYFDIEAQPDLNLDYLHGVLVVNRRLNEHKFYSLLAETEAEEELIWKEFLNLVWAYPIAPIFHFCDYEPKTVKRLAKMYNTPSYCWKPVLKRFIDIHEQMTKTVMLPVESYALKPVAKWLGFEWRNAKANGAQCVCWYEQWLKTGDRSLLDAIVEYNEDDCRATFHVKEWLTEFLS